MTATRKRPLPALALAVILAGGTAAAAADTAPATGSWIGSLDRSGRPVAVRLDINDARVGADAGRISFGEPDECGLPLKVASAAASGTVYALGASNGGRCTAYALGSLTVTRGADGWIDFAVAGPRGAAGPAGRAGPAASAPTSAPVTGTWTGSYQGRTGPVTLSMTLNAVKPGDTVGKLTFGSPDDCANPLEFSGIDARGAYFLTPSSSNGGRCQLNVFGTLVLTPGPTGLTAVMSDARGAKRFDATFAK